MKSIFTTTNPFYLDGEKGRLFCLYIEPASNRWNGSAVLFIPPFAEEMNKSRRMFSLLARHLANNGYASLLLDLYGTGDSEGDFGQANWQIWLNDIAAAVQWLRNNNSNNISFVALRLGCLLAADAASDCEINNIILWQPVTKGETYLTQFLRMKVAAEMSGTNDEKTSVKALKQQLLAGQAVEIAGYTLSPELTGVMEIKQLEDLIRNQQLAFLHWYEIVADKEREIPVVNKKIIENLQNDGFKIDAKKIVGPPFWTAVEIVDLPDLIENTTNAFIATSL